MLPIAIKKLADTLKSLPGIGPRQAMRIAFYIAERGREALPQFADAALAMKAVLPCTQCFLLHENKDGLCHVCANPARKKSLIAIVEKATDLLSLEKARAWNGRYLVIGEIGRGGVMESETKIRLAALQKFIKDECGGAAEEIMLAVSPTAQGDLNAAMLETTLRPMAQKISRLGRGIPTGGEIEFADEETLKSALDRRS